MKQRKLAPAIGLVLIALLWVLAASPAQAGPSGATLYPTNLITWRGSHSNQPLTVLQEMDQSGDDDDWDSYLEFYTASRGYIGLFLFQLPAGMSAGDVETLSLETNYRGPLRSEQRWQWQLRDFCQGRWVTWGDNSQAGGWVWTPLSFDALGDPSCYVNAFNTLKLRYHTNSGYDDSDLDYLALTVNGGQPPPPPPGDIWQPAPGVSWQWQLTGAIDASFDVQMYDIDLVDAPQSIIDQLHAAGRVVICYLSAGSWEDWRPDADQFPAAVLGQPLDGWPGERWLDIRQIDLLGPIMEARLDLAVQKGCDGVEPDNVDGYANDTGFPLTYQDQLTYNIWLANQAHSRHLSVGLKNDLDQIGDLLPYFDWALNEQCFQYDECELLLPFVNAGKAVFGVEYYGAPSSFCPQANAMDFDWLKKRLNLNAWRVACR